MRLYALSMKSNHDDSDSDWESVCGDDGDFDFTPYGYTCDPDSDENGIHYQPFDDPNDDDAPNESNYG
jgi:hypothetical protein